MSPQFVCASHRNWNLPTSSHVASAPSEFTDFKPKVQAVIRRIPLLRDQDWLKRPGGKDLLLKQSCADNPLFRIIKAGALQFGSDLNFVYM